MRKNFSLILLVLLTFFVQMVLSTLLPAHVASPELLIILVVSIGFMRGRHAGILIGFLAGALADLFIGGGLIGMHALLYTYFGFLCALPGEKFFEREIKIPLLLVAVCTLVNGLAFYAAACFTGGMLSFPVYLLHTILAATVFTVLLTIPLYPLFYWINRRITARDLEDQNSPWLRR